MENMSHRFSADDFAAKLQAYLVGEIDEHELYIWSCGFLDVKSDDKLLWTAWSRIHSLNEENLDSKATREELQYLYDCLSGKAEFSGDVLNRVRERGMGRRFGK